MVEAKHEQHPDYFKQHRKNFRYLVLENEPRIGLDIPSGSNYAFGIHASTSDHLCGFDKPSHYHVFLNVIRRRGRVTTYLASTQLLSLVSGLLRLRNAWRSDETIAYGDAVQREREQNVADPGST